MNLVLCSAGIHVQASYYNDRVGAWEPLIEPCVEEENVYRPWEIFVKVLHNITNKTNIMFLDIIHHLVFI
jgi:hypothetical protein